MNYAYFDDLARRLPGFIDRRWLLWRGSAAFSATIFGLAELPHETEAGKKRRKKRRRCRKKKNRTWCGKKCVRGHCCPDKPCGGDESCFCDRAIEGDFYCAADVIVCCAMGLCASSDECGAGSRCVRASTPGFTCCHPECGAV